MDPQRELVRHFLAALAYRTQKALRGAPEGFGTFEAGGAVRTPVELVRHMSSVLGYAGTFFSGGVYEAEPLLTLEEETARLHSLISNLAAHLTSGTQLREISMYQLLHGPLSDAMTHAGQLAMLRRLARSPVASENFIFAEISSDRLGSNQSLPMAPTPLWMGQLIHYIWRLSMLLRKR